MSARRLLLALLLAAAPAAVAAAPVPKEQLMKPPADATHYVVMSEAGKHGDEWIWTLPDGSTAYRESILLRGLIFETDMVTHNGVDGMPDRLVIRGVTPSGDVAEQFAIAEGKASWTSPADKGEAPYTSPAFYIANGGPFLSVDAQVARLAAAGSKGLALLPSGRGLIEPASSLTVNGPSGPKTIALHFMKGVTQTPIPVWLDDKGKMFAFIFGLGLLPDGYEQYYKVLETAQNEAIAALSPAVAKRFLTADARRPILFDKVRLFDADAKRFHDNRAVLVSDGKIAAVGAAGSLKAPAGTRLIDGTGRTLVPGLWDAHMHMGDDFSALSELALGVTSYRSPGSAIETSQSLAKRRAAGEVLAPEGFVSIIIDRKNPLAAQGSLAVSSQEEAIAAVRRIKDSGMSGVKFYTSMNPAWIAPAAAEAHKLGLHVHGHVPATMRPLDAVKAGYDELTHINFVIMQAMPQDIVDTANTANRFVGPAKFAKDLDLDAEPLRSFIAELARRGTAVDPTVAVFEQLLSQEAGTVAPANAPFIGTLPAATERGFKSGGYPLAEGYTRADYRASVKKLIALVGKLHKAGVTVVAGTDGQGMELVRELELYGEAGMTPAEVLATATIVPARLVGVDKRTGSIAVGKEADLLLVDGDPSRRIGDLRHVAMVVSDGVAMDGDALRAAAGFSGKPK